MDLLLLPAAVYGFVRGGWAGALTGAIAVVVVGSGLAILIGESGSGVDAGARVGALQRFGGAIAAVASLAGAVYGGWQSGWVWGGAGYLLGIIVTLGAAALSGRLGPGAA